VPNGNKALWRLDYFKMLSTVAVYGRMDFNAALGQPTFAIDEKDHPVLGTWSSSKAVDGNKDGEAWKPDNSCYYSNIHDHPWWAVDLGAALAVLGVLFTNRGDEGWGNVSTLSSSTRHREHFVLYHRLASLHSVV